MPYIKFGWDGSDVYLYGGADGPDGPHFIICGFCLLDEDEHDTFYDRPSFDFATKDELYYHLEQHRKAGHIVPQSVMDKIREDDWTA